MRSLKVLVTGATGFLGRCLMETLASEMSGAVLIGVTRHADPGRGQNLRCDLSNKIMTRRLIASVRPHVVYHAVGVPAFSKPKELHQTYLLTTINLLEALLQNGSQCCRVIIPGSALEYGHLNGDHLPAREEAPTNPVTAYGQAKLLQTRAALSYLEKGENVVIGRIFNMAGPYCPSHLAVGSWARQIALIEAKKIPPVLKVGNLNTERDFLDVRDAARALVALGSMKAKGEIYNICSGQPWKMETILEHLLQISPMRERIRVKIETNRSPDQDVLRIYGSHKKITLKTGWKPSIPLTVSLAGTLQSFRKPSSPMRLAV